MRMMVNMKRRIVWWTDVVDVFPNRDRALFAIASDPILGDSCD